MIDEEERVARTIPRLRSEWNAERHGAKGWPQFLQSVTLRGIRGWTGQSLEFRFPVVAIAGENGAGKSTVLKAAAAAYSVGPVGEGAGARTFSPDDFFPNTPWESVSGAFIDYEFRMGVTTRSGYLRKPTHRWRGMVERPERTTYFLDISRTQPIDTLIGYGRLARADIAKGNQLLLSDDSRQILSRVMSRSYEAGEMHLGPASKQVGVLTLDGRRYSNFHQGAGEDASTDLIALLQEAPRASLVLIDEVESSLHPRAQRRLMTELIDIARQKRIQLIVSTHSSFVLELLPPEARIFISSDSKGDKAVIYGATPEYAMGLMDEKYADHTELDVYCEDAQAQYLVESLLQHERPEDLRRMRIIPVGPASTVKAVGEVASKGHFRTASVAVLDADSRSSEGCVLLPRSGPPEVAVYKSFSDSEWTIVAERLGVRPGDLLDAAEDALRLPNHHSWSNAIAEGISANTRATRVWEAAVDVWIRDVLSAADREDFVERLLRDLPAPSTESTPPATDKETELDLPDA